MQKAAPIHVEHLFPELDRELISLLRGLEPREWQLPTACRLWSVKDIAAHLLDGNLRRISADRDRYFPGADGPEIENYGDLVAFLDRLNAQWVEAARRISPALLIELLEFTGRIFCQSIRVSDPHQPATFAVAWAGENESPAWFDAAREYTEKWHHQQQIRDAAHRPGLLSRKFLFPVLDTFARGLPHACRRLSRPEGTILTLRIKGEAGGEWHLVRRTGEWDLTVGEASAPQGRVTLSQEVAWRLFTKGVSPESAAQEAVIEGDSELAAEALKLVAVMG